VAATDRGRFTLDGAYAPGDDYRTDLVATAVAPGGTARIGAVARGDLDEMIVAVAGDTPGPLDLRLALRGGRTPGWSFAGKAERLGLAAFTGADAEAPPLAFDLEARGVGGRAQVEGTFARGGLAATILPSTLHLEDQVLAVDPLHLRVSGGELVLRGTGDFSEPREGRFQLDAD